MSRLARASRCWRLRPAIALVRAASWTSFLPMGRSHAFSYVRTLQNLYVIKNVR